MPQDNDYQDLSSCDQYNYSIIFQLEENIESLLGIHIDYAKTRLLTQ